MIKAFNIDDNLHVVIGKDDHLFVPNDAVIGASKTPSEGNNFEYTIRNNVSCDAMIASLGRDRYGRTIMEVYRGDERVDTVEIGKFVQYTKIVSLFQMNGYTDITSVKLCPYIGDSADMERYISSVIIQNRMTDES